MKIKSMKNIVKIIEPKPVLEQEPEKITANTATRHDPWKTVYVAWINPHGAYPTDTCIGYYDTEEEAENAVKRHMYAQYGGYIQQTTWGEIEGRIMF